MLPVDPNTVYGVHFYQGIGAVLGVAIVACIEIKKRLNCRPLRIFSRQKNQTSTYFQNLASDWDGDFETGRPCYSDYGYRSQCMLRTKANLPQFGKADVLYSTNTPGEYFGWTGTAFCSVILKE